MIRVEVRVGDTVLYVDHDSLEHPATIVAFADGARDFTGVLPAPTVHLELHRDASQGLGRREHVRYSQDPRPNTWRLRKVGPHPTVPEPPTGTAQAFTYAVEHDHRAPVEPLYQEERPLRTVQYPEHERLSKVKDRSQAIGEFLEWLQEQRVTLCSWRAAGHNAAPPWLVIDPPAADQISAYLGDLGVSRIWIPRGEGHGHYQWLRRNPEYESWGEGYVPVREGVDRLLARYFQINLGLLEDEKRAMLEALRTDRDKVGGTE